ncbi:heavy metal translocating P-type ATPase [Roseospirillum parvum]|uniref:Cu2+-exporting ATPase n=1 Tax=Roseospirillum parvum TaxID=83401 RepID=A0A1G7WNL8_9PROT|nr:heavy metal translocating P-type ATPase [Roseospirillum parvum]SDG73551.1 Cu2+-exporting ATPase [Roseospirillum parvum]
MAPAEAAADPLPSGAPAAVCRHCGAPAPAGAAFCCPGCAAAHELIQGLGLDAYYDRRCLDPAVAPLIPDPEEIEADLSALVRPDGTEPDGTARWRLDLMVEGISCAACVWLIERLLARHPAVRQGRVNMTTRRLAVVWVGRAEDAAAILAPLRRVGYRLAPYDPGRLGAATRAHEKTLLKAMAVAGFAAANIMLFSVSVWFGVDMDPATRDLMHWVSALIAVPAVGYAIRPFAGPAVAGLKGGRMTMDLPITLAVLLATAMSLWELATHGAHVYFDSAVSLLFFLLIGRFLDSRARGRARATAEQLLTLNAGTVTVLAEDGSRRQLLPERVTPGMTVLLAAGQRAGVDGRVVAGRAHLDDSLISGETVPRPVGPGDAVHAGTLALDGALTLSVAAAGEDTLLAEIVRLMETAEQGRARYVALADRVARLYAPVVHLLGLLTFLGWWGLGGLGWQPALLNGIAVLIVTCPCALGLAVPAVQVMASGRLLKGGVLLKSATALERLATVDTVVLDKTGTLTLGRPTLREDGVDPGVVARAAALAAASRHPLARALAAARPQVAPAPEVREVPGAGLVAGQGAGGPGGERRLGSRAHVGVADARPAEGPELWFAEPGWPAVRFTFTDPLRPDAPAVIAGLKARGLAVEMLSGDRPETVARIAAEAGIEVFQGGLTPAGKTARLAELAARGHRVLMVGDGLNDAPALAAAHVSLSPTSAADLSQTAADAVFQGRRLAPVLEALAVARRADRLVRQNIGLSFTYNALTVPLAVAGLVTPLVAALAMSASSVVVILNALRLGRTRRLDPGPGAG